MIMLGARDCEDATTTMVFVCLVVLFDALFHLAGGDSYVDMYGTLERRRLV
jgi:hypothetical protein